MEIVGSVAPDEVPVGIRKGRPPGIWPKLCDRAIADHQSQRVTVIKLNDDKEYRAMMNNISPRLRKLGYRARPVIVRQGEEIRVFLELSLREDKATAPVNSHVEAAV